MKLQLVVLLVCMACLAGCRDAQAPGADRAEPTTPANEASTPPAHDSLPDAAPPPLPEILARVDGAPVTREQVGRIMNRERGLRDRPLEPLEIEALRYGVVESLVNERLIDILIAEEGITVPDELLQEHMDAWRDASDLSEADMDQLLALEGVTRREFRENIRKKVAFDLYLTPLRDQTDVSEEELEDEYEMLRSLGAFDLEGPLVKTSQVFAAASNDVPESWGRAEETVREAAARLAADEDFAAVAADLSDDARSAAQGGQLPWLAEGAIGGVFDEKAFGVPVGTVTEPFRTEMGWHIVRIDERVETGPAPFELVRDQLRDDIKTRRAMQELNDRVNARRETVAIEILIPKPTASSGLPDQTGPEGLTAQPIPAANANEQE